MLIELTACRKNKWAICFLFVGVSLIRVNWKSAKGWPQSSTTWSALDYTGAVSWKSLRRVAWRQSKMVKQTLWWQKEMRFTRQARYIILCRSWLRNSKALIRTTTPLLWWRIQQTKSTASKICLKKGPATLEWIQWRHLKHRFVR